MFRIDEDGKMATILQYRPRAKTPDEDRARGPAKILIFTGVRYEALAGKRRTPGGVADALARRSRKSETAQG